MRLAIVDHIIWQQWVHMVKTKIYNLHSCLRISVELQRQSCASPGARQHLLSKLTKKMAQSTDKPLSIPLCSQSGVRGPASVHSMLPVVRKKFCYKILICLIGRKIPKIIYKTAQGCIFVAIIRVCEKKRFENPCLTSYNMIKGA